GNTAEHSEDATAATGRLHAELRDAAENKKLGTLDAADRGRGRRVHPTRLGQVLLQQHLVDLGTLCDAELLALVRFGDEDVGNARTQLAVELLTLSRQVDRTDPHATDADAETRDGDDEALVTWDGLQAELLESGTRGVGLDD